jgi:uncharacterized protein YdeI (YjbR/CyaY-like superfamily)
MREITYFRVNGDCILYLILKCCMPRNEQFYAPDRATWRIWLAEHHATSKGVWLVYYKKDSGKPRVSYDDAVEEALCFGWIDSVVNAIDDDSYMQLFSPRKPKSNWSKLNKERVARLLEQGLMQEAGLHSVRIAQENGKWDALNDVENLVVPDDMEEVFAANPVAKQHWDTFSRSVRRGILEWILNAKRPETRSKRIAQTVALAADNKKVLFDKV